MRRVVRLLVALALLVTAVGTGSAAAGPPRDARSEHQKVVDFWTVDKVRQAIPRDFAYDPATGRFSPVGHKEGHGGGGRGGGPGGGDGGGETAVTGDPWTGGGVVTDTTGKVLFELSGTYYVCSAGVVVDTAAGRSLVLTAAHCVYDNEAGVFATNWMFIPNYDGDPATLDVNGNFCDQTLHGCWVAEALLVHDGFASAGGFNGTAIQYDFAFAVIEEGGKTGSALFENAVTDDTQNISFSAVNRGTFVHDFGYPHASPYDGTDLIYCAGDANFDNRFFKLTYKLTCDMTGGSSGGLWMSQFDATSTLGTSISVNSYRYTTGDAIYGPKFNSNTESVYNAALGAGGNTVVGG